MKRIIISSYDEYIPDLTERYPEGFDHHSSIDDYERDYPDCPDVEYTVRHMSEQELEDAYNRMEDDSIIPGSEEEDFQSAIFREYARRHPEYFESSSVTASWNGSYSARRKIEEMIESGSSLEDVESFIQELVDEGMSESDASMLRDWSEGEYEQSQMLFD